MLRFIVMLPFRILFLPVLLFLKIVFWICSGLLCKAEWVFGLASGILLVLSVLGMIRVSVPQGIVAGDCVSRKSVWNLDACGEAGNTC